MKGEVALQSQIVDIGDIILKSPLIKSKFGDEILYFRHQVMGQDQDVGLNPGLKAGIPLNVPAASCGCPGFVPDKVLGTRDP